MNWNLVLHLDSDNPQALRFVAKNAVNYLNGLPNEKPRVIVVINGPGAPLCAPPHEESREVLENLFARGVEVKVCANALADFKVPHDAVFKGCEIVPAGLVEVARLQGEGFAYVKP